MHEKKNQVSSKIQGTSMCVCVCVCVCVRVCVCVHANTCKHILEWIVVIMVTYVLCFLKSGVNKGLYVYCTCNDYSNIFYKVLI